jgi:hypothetical protein
MMNMKASSGALAVMLLAAPLSLLAADPVRVVGPPAVSNPRQPQAAVDESGTIYVAFGAEKSIYVSTSDDAGKTYSDPVRVDTVPGLALGMRRGPRVVAGDGVVVVSAIGHQDGNLLAWRSSDGGNTWSDPIRVNDSPAHAREGLHGMAIGPTGEITCVWLDHRHETMQVYASHSTDGGKSWSGNQRVYASPTGNVCECCHPSVTYAANGDLYVMWRNSLAGNRDMYFGVSRDGGKTFSAGEKLGRGGWKLDACPMDGGYLAVSPKGAVTTVWRRENRVFRTVSSGQAEELIGAGLQPWAAATADGAYLVWISRRPGDLWLTTPGTDRPRKLAEKASDPVIAASISGSGPVVVLWEAEHQGERIIQATVVDDGDDE